MPKFQILKVSDFYADGEFREIGTLEGLLALLKEFGQEHGQGIVIRKRDPYDGAASDYEVLIWDEYMEGG